MLHMTSRVCGPGHPASNCSEQKSSLDEPAVIRDTLTGATLATIHPPSPFDDVVTAAAAADDRTFVLAAQNISGSSQLPCGPTRLFFARFNPANGQVALTALPIEFPATSWVNGIAISPDDTRLAVALEPSLCSGTAGIPADRPGAAGRNQISVYALPSGALMTSQSPAWLFSLTGPDNISWAADGTLAVTFQREVGETGPDFYLLSTNAQSGNGMWRGITPKPPAGWSLYPGNGLITPDGNALVAPIYQDPGGTGAFGEFSASTGDLLQVLSPEQVSHPAGLVPYYVAWTNSSGSVLVVTAPATGGQAGTQAVYGVLRGHRFTSIPGAPAPADAMRLESNTTIVF
jgi:hypothetical protein